MQDGENVVVVYNEGGGRTRKIRGQLKDSNIHIVVVLDPEEQVGKKEDDGEWKSLDLEKIELTRRHVVSVGYPKHKTE